MGCPPSASIWLQPLTRAAAVEVGADPSCSPSQMPEGLACGEGPDLADGQPSSLLVAALGDSPLSLALSHCCQRLAGKLCQRCLRGKQAAAGAAGLSRSRFKCASPAAAPVGAVGPGVCVRVHFLHFLIEDLKSLSGQGGLRGGREGWSCGVCLVVLTRLGVRGGQWCHVPAGCAPQLPPKGRLCILVVLEQAHACCCPAGIPGTAVV